MPDGSLLAVEGTLRHDEGQPGMWGCYRVDNAKLDLTTFQGLDGHWAEPQGTATAFYDGDLRVDVWALSNEEA